MNKRYTYTLVIFSILSIAIFELFNESKELYISHSNHEFSSIDDSHENGISTAQLDNYEQQSVLKCDLRKSHYAWPICGLRIQLGQSSTQGLDLSSYSWLELDVDYRDQTSASSKLRVFLRNYDQDYSQKQNKYLTKYHGIEYLPNSAPLIVPIEQFQVLTWWLVDNNVSIENSSRDLNNTVYLELITSSKVTLGKKEITINSIKFIGNYISPEIFYSFTTLIWLVSGIIFLVFYLFTTKNLITNEKI